MYYKRISDLKPLGEPERISTTPPKYNWDKITPTSIDPNNVAEPSALHAKSLWFSVAIAKDKDNKPTGDRESIYKFENKRLNVYKFIKTIEEMYSNTEQSETSIITTDILSAKTLQTDFIGLKNKASINTISADSVEAKIGYINTNLTTQSISANTLTTIDDCQITNISGTKFNFNSYNFTNIAADAVTTPNAKITTLKAQTINAPQINVSQPKINTLIYKSVEKNAFRVDKGNIWTYFTINTATELGEYEPGDLVRFGKQGESADWEVTLAESGSGSNYVANSVIGEISSGLMLDSEHYGTVKPVVLLGNTKVKVRGTANVGDRLYLSNVVGENKIASTTVNGKPIAIALKPKYSSGTALLECFVRFNLS